MRGQAQAGVILCFGDSLTQGIRGPGIEQSYPKGLEGHLESAGHTFTVINGGNWGDTCDQLIRRLPQAIADATRRGPLEAILLLGGTNDIMRGVSPNEILGKLRQLVATASNAPYMPRVGILSVPPMKIGTTHDRARQEVNRGILKLCSEPGTLLGRRFLVDLDAVDLVFLAGGDGVHFSAGGYAEFGNRAFQAVQLALLAGPTTRSSATPLAL